MVNINKTTIHFIKNAIRSRQGSNLRGETPLDFKSNALTTRPRLLYITLYITEQSESYTDDIIQLCFGLKSSLKY